MPDVAVVPRWPTGRELVRQVAAVMPDMAALVTAPLFRRRHLGWSATPEELLAHLPGDEPSPLAHYRSMRGNSDPGATRGQLATDGQGGTRLVTRSHAGYEWKEHPAMALFGYVMEFGDFAMLRAMLRDIKQRAETPPHAPFALEART